MLGTNRPRGAGVRPPPGGQLRHRGTRTGVSEALRQFVELIRDPRVGARPRARRVCRAGSRRAAGGQGVLNAPSGARLLVRGRGWPGGGSPPRPAPRERTPSSSETARRGDLRLHRPALRRLLEGYAQAQRELRGRAPAPSPRAVLALLLREPPARGGRAPRRGPIRRLAAVAGNRAARPCRRPNLGRVGRRLSADALVASFDGIGCALLPAGSARGDEPVRAAEGTIAALGPRLSRAPSSPAPGHSPRGPSRRRRRWDRGRGLCAGRSAPR